MPEICCPVCKEDFDCDVICKPKPGYSTVVECPNGHGLFTVACGDNPMVLRL